MRTEPERPQCLQLTSTIQSVPRFSARTIGRLDTGRVGMVPVVGRLGTELLRGAVGMAEEFRPLLVALVARFPHFLDIPVNVAAADRAALVGVLDNAAVT